MTGDLKKPERPVRTVAPAGEPASVVVDPAFAQPEPATEHDDPQPGDVLAGRYVLERQLGKGGMGWVFRAKDVALGRTVAIKLLFPWYARNPEVYERFTREARSIASLDHPNVVPVFDVGCEGDRHYFVMKLLEGQTLHARLGAVGFEPERAIDTAIEILRGLEHMHARGLIHRDVKPGNVMLTDEGRVVILDFGILRATEREDRLTRAGLFMGTPEYVAPELARSAPGDARTDVYSLGITLYEMLTGHVPFEAPNSIDVVMQHLCDRPSPPSSFDPSIGRDLDAIVLRSLAKDPDDRFQSAAEMREALEALPREAPAPPAPRLGPATTFVIPLPRRSRRGPIVVAAAVVLLASAVVALWAGTRHSERTRPPIVAVPLAPRPAPEERALELPGSVDPQPPPPMAPISTFSDRLFPVEPAAEPAGPSSPAPPRPASKRPLAKAPRPAAQEAPAAPEGSALERGRAALRARDASAAVRHFLEASRQQPGSAAPFRGLGDAYAAVGNRVAAVGAYRRYLVLNPNARDADAVRAKLRNLGGHAPGP